jgi:hypothetical protein
LENQAQELKVKSKTGYAINMDYYNAYTALSYSSLVRYLLYSYLKNEKLYHKLNDEYLVQIFHSFYVK